MGEQRPRCCRQNYDKRGANLINFEILFQGILDAKNGQRPVNVIQRNGLDRVHFMWGVIVCSYRPRESHLSYLLSKFNSVSPIWTLTYSSRFKLEGPQGNSQNRPDLLCYIMRWTHAISLLLLIDLISPGLLRWGKNGGAGRRMNWRTWFCTLLISNVPLLILYWPLSSATPTLSFLLRRWPFRKSW